MRFNLASLLKNSDKKGVNGLFLLVSIVIASLFIGSLLFFYHKFQKNMETELADDAIRFKQVFLSSITASEKTLLLASLSICSDQIVKETVGLAHHALTKGENIPDALHDRLKAHLLPFWYNMQKDIKVNQLHIHLRREGNILSFLRMHDIRHGDILNDVRHTIRNTYETASSTAGFECGRVKCGLRAVQPIFDVSDREEIIGTAEIGLSLDNILVACKEGTNAEWTVLLLKGVVDKASFKSDQNMRPLDVIGGYRLESTTDQHLQGVLTQDTLNTIKQQPIIKQVGDAYFRLSSFPFHAFSADSPEGREIGMVVIRQDITARVSAYNDTFTLTVFLGCISFLLIEFITYFSIKYLATTLTNVIDEQTTELATFNTHLAAEVSRRKEAEVKLQQRNVQYKLLLDKANDLIQSVDRSGSFIFVNNRWCSVMGYSADEALSLTFMDVLHPDEREHCMPLFKHLLAGISPGVVTTRFVTKDGETVWLEGNVTGFTEENVFIGSIGIFRDITEQRKAEAEKERLHQQLMQSQKMQAIGTLAGGIAHDFNNILMVIQGNVELCNMKLAKGVEITKNLNKLESAVSHAASLVKQLLVFSKKEIGTYVDVNVNETISNLLKMFNRILGVDIRLHTHLAPDLWHIKADPTGLEQIIMNLAINARDAMPSGGDITFCTSNVTISAEEVAENIKAKTGEFVRIIVSDTGSGISEEFIDRIFEPFFTTKPLGKGTGLGLSVVYGMLQRHEGWIDVASDKNGTSFKLYLPRLQGELLDVDNLKHIGAEGSLLGKHETILVVDDNPDLLEILTDTLKENNYDVLTASSAEEAMKVFNKANDVVRLLLTDVVMKGATGIELANQLRARQPNLAVILLSGYSKDKDSGQLAQDSHYMALQKPIELKKLLRIIAEELS